MVRRAINRYKTPPSGYEYDEVLKKGKAFYRNNLEFIMAPFTSKNGECVLWSAETPPVPPFTLPSGARKYKFNTASRRWEEITV